MVVAPTLALLKTKFSVLSVWRSRTCGSANNNLKSPDVQQFEHQSEDLSSLFQHSGHMVDEQCYKIFGSLIKTCWHKLVCMRFLVEGLFTTRKVH